MTDHRKAETRFVSKFAMVRKSKVQSAFDDDQVNDDEDDEEDDDDEDRSLTGYAIVFNSDSEDLGGFIERIDPAALTRSLTEASAGSRNIYALWSHDWSQPLGSTRGGKLKVERDDKGLRFTLDPARLTPAQRDAAKDGELQMSFGFIVLDDAWNDDGDMPVRTVRDLDLLEVSPVAMPAYPETSAALRSLESYRGTSTRDAQHKYSSRAIRLDALKRLADKRLR